MEPIQPSSFSITFFMIFTPGAKKVDGMGEEEAYEKATVIFTLFSEASLNSGKAVPEPLFWT